MKYKTQSGFTIVELLIVVVVIAILAAITIVSYNGITQQANASAAKSTAATVQKKIELYYSVHSGYPVDGDALNNPEQPYHLPDIEFNTPIDSNNGKNTVRILKCSEDTASDQASIGDTLDLTGIEIRYYDYEAGDSNYQTVKLGTGDSCPEQEEGIL